MTTQLKLAQLERRMRGAPPMSEAEYQYWMKVDFLECLFKILLVYHHNNILNKISH